MDTHFLARLDRHQVGGVLVVALLRFVLRLLAVDGQPARPHQHFAFGLEAVAGADGNARGHLVFGAREKDRHETPHHQVVDLLFGLAQAVRWLQRGDDGEVVAYLAVIEDAFAGFDVVALECGGRVGGQVLHRARSQHFEGLAHHRHIVFGQRARVGPRVGQRLVAFVQALGDRQRGLGAETEPAVGLALQGCQVEQQRAGLGGRFALLGDGGGLAANRIGNVLCLDR